MVEEGFAENSSEGAKRGLNLWVNCAGARAWAGGGQDQVAVTVAKSRTCMGKRQRHSEFVGLTDEELLALIQDPATPSRLRRKAIREAKFRGLRNVRNRRNR